jgi:hypothetical protein
LTTTINASTSSGLVVSPDNSGVVQLQYNGQPGPAFNAALNSSGAVTVTANNPINFNQTQFERGGTNYSTSTGRFTAPITGFYFFGVNLLIEAAQGVGAISVEILINGAIPSGKPNDLYTDRTNAATFGYQQLSGTFVLSLTAGQYVTVVPYTTTIFFGGNGSSNAQTRFTGFLIP